MKERKQWKKRVVSLLMALALVITQIGVWNAGKESVQAAETEVYKADFSDEKTVAWDKIWSVSSDNTTFEVKENYKNNNDKALNIWSQDAQVLTMVHTETNVEAGRYYLSIQTNGGSVNSGEICVSNGQNEKKRDIAIEDGLKIYKTTEALEVTAGASVKIIVTIDLSAGGWGYIDDITLTKADSEDTVEPDTDEYSTKTLYFKYTGNGTPAILLWDNCGDSLKIGDDTTGELIDNKVRYKMNLTDQKNWYRIVFKYKTNEVKNKDVGFDLGEISDDAYRWILSMDYAYNNHKSAYEIIFSDKYNDPAIIQDDYDTVVSYADAIEEESNTDPIVEDAPITIDKVKTLSPDFIMGADISSMISELESGVVYKDYDGNALNTLDDVVQFLADQGINHIRVRVWNDPYDANRNGYGGGNNDVTKAKEFADACRKAGIKMLVDFHCSDLWTDPGKQQAPKAWKGYTLEQKKVALTAFIKDSLNQIDSEKNVVDMVQVGNETTGGFIGETDVAKMCELFSAGSAGVKAYNADTKVVIHVESPQKGSVTTWAKNLSDNTVDYDIIATSYYPYWHGTLDNLKKEFATVKKTYSKDVMVAETSYAYTLDDTDGHENTVRVGNNDTGDNVNQPFTEQGQATYLRNLINAVNEAGGLGVYYWEPAWITVGDTTGLTGDALEAKIAENKAKWEANGSGWASSYASEYDAKDAGLWFGGSAVDNQALFYADGTATPAMHVWKYVRTGAKSNLVGVESVESLEDSIYEGTASEYKLPETVKVTYTDGSTEDATIIWNVESKNQINLAKVGTYEVTGNATLGKDITTGAFKGMEVIEVRFTLIVKPKNLITDNAVVEFEESAADAFSYSVDSLFKKFNDKPDPKSGSTSLGWWNNTSDQVAGTVVYKNPIILKKGSYVFETYAQGMAGDKVSLQILDSDDKILFEGEAAELTGYASWKTPTVAFTLDKDTAIKLCVKVDTQADGWGSVDVLYLHENGGSNSGSSTVTPSTPSTDNTVSDNDKKDGTDDKSNEKSEVTTEEKKVTTTTSSGKKVEATVSVTRDKDGNVTEASATVTTTGTKAKLSAEEAKAIAKAAGADSVAVTSSVTDKNGKEKYTVTVDSRNLAAGKKLQVVAIDPKTGEYKLVNAKTYTVGKDGTLDVKLAAGAEYKLVTPAEVKAAEKAILKTVAVEKKAATVKSGKKTQIKLSSTLDMDNVKSITYKVDKKSVASVSKTGKITTKGKGTVTIRATVTLNNGKKKTVSMELKVR